MSEDKNDTLATSDEDVKLSERQEEIHEQVGDTDPHGEAGKVFVDGAPRPKYESAQDDLDEQSPVTTSVPGARVDTVESPHPSPEAVADKPI